LIALFALSRGNGGSNANEVQGSSTTEYYTTNGDRPSRFPRCSGFFDICLGQPLRTAKKLFGEESERFRGATSTDQEPVIAHAWDLGPLRVSIEAEESGRIVGMTVVAGELDRVGLGLPSGLVLGQSTMGDVTDILGDPYDQGTLRGEGIVVRSSCFLDGPEGSEVLSFSHGTREGSTRDPGDSPTALAASTVTSFSVGYRVHGNPCALGD
jgi:hypothetical protein